MDVLAYLVVDRFVDFVGFIWLVVVWDLGFVCLGFLIEESDQSRLMPFLFFVTLLNHVSKLQPRLRVM